MDKKSANMSDVDLVARIGDSCRSAEAEFCRRYARKTLAYLRSQARTPHQAEDLAQETMCVVLTAMRAGKIDNPASLGAYVRQTAKNLLIAEVRKARKREYVLGEGESMPEIAEPDRALTDIIRSEADRIVLDALERLRMTRDRDVLIQHYLLELERPAICDSMSIDRDHFDRVVSRARQRARKLIDGWREELLFA